MPGEWTLEQAILGFVRMNVTHSGEQLGRVLFNVCNRLRIVPKVSADKLWLIF